MRIFLFFSLMIRTSRLSLNERKRHSLIKINFHYSFFFIINRRLKEKRKENYFKRMRFLIKKKEETLSMALSFHYMRAITSLLFLIKESLGDPRFKKKLIMNNLLLNGSLSSTDKWMKSGRKERSVRRLWINFWRIS